MPCRSNSSTRAQTLESVTRQLQELGEQAAKAKGEVAALDKVAQECENDVHTLKHEQEKAQAKVQEALNLAQQVSVRA